MTMPTNDDHQSAYRHPFLISVDRRRDTTLPKRHTIIGALIRSRRETLGLSQGKLSEAMDCDHALVSRWEGGTRRPSVDQVPILAAALDLPEWSIACAICGLDPTAIRDTLRAELVPLVRAEVLATVTLALGDVGEEAA